MQMPYLCSISKNINNKTLHTTKDWHERNNSNNPVDAGTKTEIIP